MHRIKGTAASFANDSAEGAELLRLLNALLATPRPPGGSAVQRQAAAAPLVRNLREHRETLGSWLRDS